MMERDDEDDAIRQGSLAWSLTAQLTNAPRGLPGGVADGSAPLPSVPARIGRFHVLEQIGAGGMGVVYAAYDDELDRKVAIKLLHTEFDAVIEERPRLLREAQALARLSHPNVVQIFEIGHHDGRLFVAMEYIRGPTLQTWLRERGGPRPWREVLAVFLAAGSGLAAAHRVGLIHRDFKPGNVMIGRDNRVRVVDFGLVSSLCHAEPDRVNMVSKVLRATPARRALTTPLTVTGDILGTPAYMAPEQFNGRRCNARTDQFSFCVSLFEALYGVRPFAGATVWEALEASERGEIRRPPAGTRVPAWLHAAVVRGLAPDPAARWPSMTLLLEELGREHHALARIRVGAGFLSVMLAFGLLASWLYAPSAAARCAAEVDVLAHLRLADRAAGLSPYGRDRLGRLTDAWRDARRDLCIARHNGVLTTGQAQRSADCLKSYYDLLVNIAEQLESGADTLGLDELPPAARVAACADPSDRSQGPALASAEDRATAREINRGLAEAQALLITGQYQASEARASLVVRDARALGDGPTSARALYHLGRAQGYGRRADLAGTTLREADRLAVEYDLPDLAADTALRLLRHAADDREHAPEGHLWYDVLRGRLARLGELRGAREAEAHYYLGDIALASDPAAARAEFESVLASDAASPDVRAAAQIGLGRLIVRDDPVAGRQHFQAALQLLEAEMGPAHPKLVPALLGITSSYLEESRIDRAEDTVQRALELARGDSGQMIAEANTYAALIAEGRGDLLRARDLAEVARRALRAPGIPPALRHFHARILDLLGRVTYQTGDKRGALGPYLELLTLPEDPADAKNLAVTYQNAASIALDARAFDLARRFVTAARPGFARMAPTAAREAAAALAVIEVRALLHQERLAEAAEAARGFRESWDPHHEATDQYAVELRTVEQLVRARSRRSRPEGP